jgi:mRNA interferase MazF
VKRGDLVTVALSGDYGKPRPALVIQADALSETNSVLVCLLTTTLREAPLYRLPLAADAGTGLRETSQIMVDKIVAVRRDRCGPPIGYAGETVLAALRPWLALMVGVAS